MSSQKHKKHVISISLGSSERDAQATVVLGEQELLVERRGTDGDFAKARQLMETCDGKVDAIGLGGTDLYVYAGDTRYTFRESAKLIANVKNTPVLDGSGLKNSLERRLIVKLAAEKVVDFKDKKVLLVCGVDRFGMAQALQEVEETGYGIVSPGTDELTLDEPKIVKQGGKFGVRLKASAPSIHMICNKPKSLEVA